MITQQPMEGFSIESWTPTHPRWVELMQLVAELDQVEWVHFNAEWHYSTHMLVACRGQKITGFLRFVVQEIGPDNDCLPVQVDGVRLTEAKVLAFGVRGDDRRQGIGRQLQEALIQQARQLGCYQVRSHSGGEHDANQRLKLGLGFGVHPVARGSDRRGGYFILPLRGQDSQPE